MAQRVLVKIMDDLTDEEGAETVAFAYGGYDYEIDLTEANQEALFAALKPYIEAARTTAKRPKTRAKTKIVASAKKPTQLELADDPAVIREWAQKNGYEVSERGRISRDVREAFHAAS
jgi:hypothetical protein